MTLLTAGQLQVLLQPQPRASSSRWAATKAYAVQAASWWRWLAPASKAQPRRVFIQVDPSKHRQQDFEGWGTSLAWFANILGGFPQEVQDPLLDLLFDRRRGLGLQIVRYNIGGSGPGSPDAGNLRYGGNVPALIRPDGSYDWDADAAQRAVLLAARQRGALLFEAFSNSPPWWMTVSGRASGGRVPWTDNLDPAWRARFAAYLADVVLHFQEAHGLTFRTVDPFNEPSTWYWRAGGRQEGCHFSLEGQAATILALQAALQERGLLARGVSIAASDETSIDAACATLAGLPADALQATTQVNTHSYKGTMRSELQSATRAAGKRLWMSEWGSGAYALGDMAAGLELALRILADVNVMGAQAWVYWQAVEDTAENNWWGLLQCPFTTYATTTASKQYFVMLQHSRFIRHGAVIVATADPLTLAAVSAPVAADVLDAPDAHSSADCMDTGSSADSSIQQGGAVSRPSAALAAAPKAATEGVEEAAAAPRLRFYEDAAAARPCTHRRVQHVVLISTNPAEAGVDAQYDCGPAVRQLLGVQGGLLGALGGAAEGAEAALEAVADTLEGAVEGVVEGVKGRVLGRRPRGGGAASEEGGGGRQQAPAAGEEHGRRHQHRQQGARPLHSIPPGAARVDVFRTSAGENARHVDGFALAPDGKFAAALAPRSVTSFVVTVQLSYRQTD